MRNIPALILRDFLGMIRVAGVGVALRWLWSILRNFGACRRVGNLQPADLAMGPGPFRVRLRRSSASLYGEQVISGIREIWIRDVYLFNDFLQIRDGDVALDLGSNMGNFSMLALGHGPRVRVVAVEANPVYAAKWKKNIGQAGWQDRATLVEAFIGGVTTYQENLAAQVDADGPRQISQDQLLSDHQLSRIDFLKCDIEGSEYGLLTPDSPILARTRQLAIEVHKPAGDWQGFRTMIESQGFETMIRSEDAGGYIMLARRKGAAA